MKKHFLFYFLQNGPGWTSRYYIPPDEFKMQYWYSICTFTHMENSLSQQQAFYCFWFYLNVRVHQPKSGQCDSLLSLVEKNLCCLYLVCTINCLPWNNSLKSCAINAFF